MKITTIGRNNKYLQLYCIITILIVQICTKITNSSIPRSTRHNHHESYNTISSSSNPPWNPSSKIDNEGFLKDYYRCIPGEWEESEMPELYRRCKIPSIVQIRQVPGDGNCLFHSIATCLSLAENKTHVNINDARNNNNHYGGYLSTLLYISGRLRQEAVNCLSCRPRRPLFIQGSEYLRACDLVDAAASQYNLTGSKYCDLMRKESYWGGGPEIVALCNVLRRPIYVYELVASTSASLLGTNNNIRGGGGAASVLTAAAQDICINTGFCLRRMACFGSPKFNRRDAIHILSADSRFPDVTPGKQLQNGNHFLALFPASTSTTTKIKSMDFKGGGGSTFNRKREFFSSRSHNNNILKRKKSFVADVEPPKSSRDISYTATNNGNEINNVLVTWFTKIRKLLIQISFSGTK